MATTIPAVYENGVFRPKQPINLPEQSEVELEVRPLHTLEEMPTGEGIPTLDDLYAIMSRSHPTGQHDLAERHNEHQP
jgi:predicted DNA-binding antitoxin AbrB/MazE fold protein